LSGDASPRAASADDDVTRDEKAALLDVIDGARARERSASSGHAEFDSDASDRRSGEALSLDDVAFISHDPTVSLVQSALDAYFHESSDDASDADRRSVSEGLVESDDPDTPVTGYEWDPAEIRPEVGRRVFDQFSRLDARWLESKIAEAQRQFGGKAPFNAIPPAPVVLPNRFRLVLVGDWGSGIPRARKVAKQMRRVLDEGKSEGLCQHVVHLGDVYYSGWPREYRDRFLAYWPVDPWEVGTIGSWSINGNHDMFSGGHGYFGTLLGDARFARQQQSSTFNFVNDHWRILGLDTAWEDHGLRDPQSSWLAGELADQSKRTILLSHHQLVSARGKVAKSALSTKMEPLLRHCSVHAWFWGHEHHCVLFEPYLNIRFPRCIGHGGVPEYAWRRESQPLPKGVSYEFRGSFWHTGERWTLFGFAVLDFDGVALQVRYVDENGTTHHTESLT
jgi:Predicted phosphohydrolases